MVMQVNALSRLISVLKTGWFVNANIRRRVLTAMNAFHFTMTVRGREQQQRTPSNANVRDERPCTLQEFDPFF